MEKIAIDAAAFLTTGLIIECVQFKTNPSKSTVKRLLVDPSFFQFDQKLSLQTSESMT